YGSLDDLKDMYTKWVERYFMNPVFKEQQDVVHDLAEEVIEYFQKKRKTFNVPMELYGTPFQKDVWHALVDTIPYGQTRTYKDIAEAIGRKTAVRAVGGAVNKNPISIIVPCHRVIGSDGTMVGYNGGLDKKEYLLSLER